MFSGSKATVPAARYFLNLSLLLFLILGSNRLHDRDGDSCTCADYFSWRMCPHLIAVLAIVYPLEYDIDFLLAPSHPESHRREYLKVDGTFRP